MQATTRDVLEVVATVIEAAVDGMRRSPHMLDPRTAPQTTLQRSFSLHPKVTNTRKYRDAKDRRMRLSMELTVRCCWRLHPKNQAATQGQALDDMDRAIYAAQTDTRVPLSYCRVLYLRTTAGVTPPSREWLFHDVVLGVEFDRSLLATDNQ